MAAMAENNKPGDLELWRATTDLYTPLIAGCLDPHGPPLATLERAARAKLATLPRNSSVAQLAPYTLERLSQYGELEDEFLLFYVDLGRQRLRLATGMFDAREVEKRILVPSLPVPLVSSWDGSRASVENDPTTPGAVVLTRGRLRKVLPPLPPPLPRQYPNAP
jgi:hypothetical protein